ncbi:hypothetical protein EBR44_15010, partial [bacterium]|nr:hypothetical protein [bacterium]
FGAHLVDKPEERERMNPRIQRRQITHDVGALAPGALQTLAAPQLVVALEPEPSGLAAWVVRLPPSASLAVATRFAVEAELTGVGNEIVTTGAMPEMLFTTTRRDAVLVPETVLTVAWETIVNVSAVVGVQTAR